jgi:hypothetical protein
MLLDGVLPSLPNQKMNQMSKFENNLKLEDDDIFSVDPPFEIQHSLQLNELEIVIEQQAVQIKTFQKKVDEYEELIHFCDIDFNQKFEAQNKIIEKLQDTIRMLQSKKRLKSSTGISILNLIKRHMNQSTAKDNKLSGWESKLNEFEQLYGNEGKKSSTQIQNLTEDLELFEASLLA